MSETGKQDVKTAIATWISPALITIVGFFLMQLYSDFKEVKTNVDEMSKIVIKLELLQEVNDKQKQSDKEALENFEKNFNKEIDKLKESIKQIDKNINERNR